MAHRRRGGCSGTQPGAACDLNGKISVPLLVPYRSLLAPRPFASRILSCSRPSHIVLILTSSRSKGGMGKEEDGIVFESESHPPLFFLNGSAQVEAPFHPPLLLSPCAYNDIPPLIASPPPALHAAPPTSAVNPLLPSQLTCSLPHGSRSSSPPLFNFSVVVANRRHTDQHRPSHQTPRRRSPSPGPRRFASLPTTDPCLPRWSHPRSCQAISLSCRQVPADTRRGGGANRGVRFRPSPLAPPRG